MKFANLFVGSLLLLHMPYIDSNIPGLQLNTPSNNQQSAQLLGTFNVNQAGSNAYPAIQQGKVSGALTNFMTPQNPAVLNNLNVGGGVSIPAGGTSGPAYTQPSRVQQLTAPGYNRNPAEDTELKSLLDALNAGGAEDQRLIDEAYGASNNYLNQAESTLRGDFPTVLSDIEGQYGTGLRQAESGKSSTLGTIQEQQTMADQRNTSVMADARRLYDELIRGYGQRFGGASSAGGAASEIASVERQRQQGKIQQDYGNTVRQIEQARTQVESKFQDQLAQLKQVKDQAVNEANRDFQNKLLQISQSRAENEQAKAQARLSALQDLRNKVYQINLQNMQFQQTLQAQREQANTSLADYATTLGGYGQTATTATSAFTPEVSSNLQTSTNTTNSTNPYVGNIFTSARNKLDDWLGGGSSW